MVRQNRHVCPMEKADSLDTKLRRWLQNPRTITGPFLSEGMTVLEVGCGPGFFTIDMADLVGSTGRVIAVDLQEGMLQKVRDKIAGTDFENRIVLHKCESDTIGVTERADFVLLFYVVHEVPDPDKLFAEIKLVLKPGGKVLIYEPPFHVSKTDFAISLQKAADAGLKVIDRPRTFLDKAAVLQNG